MNEQQQKLVQKKVRRGKFLNALYDETNGSRHSRVHMNDTGKSIGLSNEETYDVVTYLCDEGLVKHASLGGIIEITHMGIIEVEESRSEPTKPTEHFPPLNVINIGSMVGSQIVQGSTATHIEFVAAEGKAQIEKFVQELSAKLSQLSLPSQAFAELQADVTALQAQLALQNPKKGIVKECLGSIRTILEGAAGSVLATHLLSQFPSIGP